MEQRKIAFRAWDKVKKEMNYKVLVGNTDVNDPNYTCNLVFQKETAVWVHADHFCIELMQYTGLKDKNGKDIYEGDLLNIGASEFGFITNDKGENVTYEVKVDGCDYILFRTDLKLNWGRLSRLEEMYWHCQVVDNIYENPELLS